MAGRTGYTPTPATFDPQVHMDAIYNHFDTRVGETVANVAALPASGNWTGRTIWAASEKQVWVWDATWKLSGGPATIGNVGADANATVVTSKMQRSFDGVVSAIWRQERTGGTTYAVSTVVGVLPVGFRPNFTVTGTALTYGSGTPATVYASNDGIIRLAAPAPAGHTITICNLTFNQL